MEWPTRLFNRSRDFEDLSSEIRQHFEEKTDELVSSGMSRADAEALARREFGNAALIEERAREAWGWRWLDIVEQDLRYAQRQLRRSPAFASVALLLLGFGIGAGTAVFTVARQVLLSGLPVQNSQELIQLGIDNQKDGVIQRRFSYPAFRLLSQTNRLIDGMYARSDGIKVDVLANGSSDIARAAFETPNAASVLGLVPVLGRLLNSGDDKTSGAAAVVLSYSYWHKRFGGDPSVIGKTISIDTMPFVIAGVTPASYHGIEIGVDPDITMPVIMAEAVRRLPVVSNRNSWAFTVIARRKPGATNEKILASLAPAFQSALDDWSANAPLSMADRFRQFASLLKLRVDPASAGASSESRSEVRQPLILLALITGIIFLVTCANLAGLTLARMQSRTSEIGTRLALGCGPRRLFVQLFIESTLLATLGGVAGLLMAVWASPLIPAMLGNRELSSVVRPDISTVASGLFLAIVGGVVLGIVPALRATRVDPQVSIRGESRTASSKPSRIAKALIVCQIAGSLVLTLTAGQFVRSLQNYKEIDAGFEPDHLVYVSLRPDLVRYNSEKNSMYVQQLYARIQALPGVKSVTYSTSAMGDLHWNTLISFPGYTPSGMTDDAVGRNIAGPRFVETMGLRLISGRDFDDRDLRSSQATVIVNESFARHFFGNTDVLGRTFSFIDSGKRLDTIVGVVADALDRGIKERARPVAYSAYSQDPLGQVTLAVRTQQEPKAVAGEVLSAIRSIDPQVPVESTTTAEAQMNESLQRERMLAQLTSGLGSLAGLVATLGLYGLLAYSVVRRTREIAIRMALGSSLNGVRWLLIREGAVLVSAGVAIGCPLYFALARLIQAQVFQVRATDPTTMSIVLSGLFTVSALAIYIPVSRSARVNPVKALKYE